MYAYTVPQIGLHSELFKRSFRANLFNTV